MNIRVSKMKDFKRKRIGRNWVTTFTNEIPLRKTIQAFREVEESACISEQILAELIVYGRSERVRSTTSKGVTYVERQIFVPSR